MTQIGIDLGNHSIKCVELGLVSKSSTLLNFAIYESDKLKLDFSNEENINMYAQKLKEFFKELDFGTREVSLSLPENEVYLNVKIVPKMSDKEIRNYINLQAPDIFPENINNLTYDYKILGEKDSGNIEILIVGAKKERIESYVNLLKRAELTPKVFEAKTISLSRVIDTKESNEAVIILDFGYLFSTLHVSLKRIPRFIKTISIGSNSLNKALIQNLNLTNLQAENYKIAYGLNPEVAEGKIYSFLKPLIDSYILDIKRSIIYFLDKNKSVSISKIYLTGGMAKLPGLEEYLQKNLNIPVEVFNPFTKIKVGSDLSKYENNLKELSTSLSAPIGLSGIEILWAKLTF